MNKQSMGWLRSFSFTIALSLFVVPGASCKEGTATKGKKKLDPNKDALATLVNAEKVSVGRGKSVNSKLTIHVADGFHVQSNPAKPRLIPTTLRLDKNASVEVSEIKYPEGKPYRLKGSNRDISVYEGNFEIAFKVTAGSKAGKTELVGKVRYQACNDVTCFFPKSIPVKIPVIVN